MAAGPIQSRWLTSRPYLMSDDEDQQQQLVVANKKCRVDPSPITSNTSAESQIESRPTPNESLTKVSPSPSSDDEDDEEAAGGAFQPITGRRRRNCAPKVIETASPPTFDHPSSPTHTPSVPEKSSRLRIGVESENCNSMSDHCKGSSVKDSATSRQSEQDAGLETVVGEKDYLEFRAVTKRIKDVLIDCIGGTEPDFRQTVASQIIRGRCSFTRSAQPPESILQDNPQLKEYQVAAVHWLLTLFKNGLNGLVADDMGLGKSAECICFLKRLYADHLMELPTVVACPATLLDNWCFEFKKWAPEMKVIKYHGSQNERKMLMRQFETGLEALEDEYDDDEYDQEDTAEGSNVDESMAEEDHSESTSTPELADQTHEAEGESVQPVTYPVPPDCAYHILVTTHQTLANRFDRQLFFKQHNFGFLVVDEAHSLKNSASLRYQQMNKNVNAPNRLLLTGSPVQNQISELKNLLTFLNPYRKCSFDINDALTYHTAVWKQAVDRGNRQKARPKDGSTPSSPGGSPSLLAESDESKSEPVKTESSTPDNESSTPGLVEAALKREVKVDGSITESELKVTEVEDTNPMLPVAGEKQQTDPEILFYQQLLAPLILRRLKAEVIDNFPRKTNKIQLCDMLPIQQKLYDAEIRAARPMLVGVTSVNGSNGRKRGPSRRGTKKDRDNMAAPSSETASSPISKRASTVSVQSVSGGGETTTESPSVFIKGLLFRLRRICNHPLLYQHYFNKDERLEFANFLKNELDEFKQFSLDRILQHISDWSDYDLHVVATANHPKLKKFEIPPEEFLQSCKVKQMLELIDQLCTKKDEKVLIFSQFTSFLNVIGDVLSIHRPQFRFLRLDGSTKVYERSSMVSAFQSKESEFKIFLLSTKAGGVGLNLTSANTVLLMDQDWNPHNDRQAEDRVHRLGQTEDVTVYRICCRHSFEETVLSCCKKKLELDEAFGGTAEALPLEIFEDIIRTVKVAPPEPESTSSSPSTTTDKEEISSESIDVKDKTSNEDHPKQTQQQQPIETEDSTNATTKLKRNVDKKTRNGSNKRNTSAVEKDNGLNEPAAKKRATSGSSSSTGTKSSSTEKQKVNQNLAPAAQRLGNSSVSLSSWQDQKTNNKRGGGAAARSGGRKKAQVPVGSTAPDTGKQMLLPGCESDDEETNHRAIKKNDSDKENNGCH